MKVKRVQNTGLMKWQTSGLPLEMRIGFKVALAAAYSLPSLLRRRMQRKFGEPLKL